MTGLKLDYPHIRKFLIVENALTGTQLCLAIYDHYKLLDMEDRPYAQLKDWILNEAFISSDPEDKDVKSLQHNENDGWAERKIALYATFNKSETELQDDPS
jgi:hypothetical protein